MKNISRKLIFIIASLFLTLQFAEAKDILVLKLKDGVVRIKLDRGLATVR